MIDVNLLLYVFRSISPLHAKLLDSFILVTDKLNFVHCN